MIKTPNLSPLRVQFPALQETDVQDQPYVYFDGPGGTTHLQSQPLHWAPPSRAAGVVK